MSPTTSTPSPPVRRSRRGRRRTAARGREPQPHPLRPLRRRQRRLQPDAPRRHDRHPGREPVGVRPRDAHRGPHGPGGEGLARPRGDPEDQRAVRQAGVAGRDPDVHGAGHRSRAGRPATAALVELELSATNQDGEVKLTGTATAAARPVARAPASHTKHDTRNEELSKPHGDPGRTGGGRDRVGSRHRAGVRAVHGPRGRERRDQRRRGEPRRAGHRGRPGRADLQGHRGARREGGPELRLGERLRGRGPDHRDRGQRVRQDRHPGQQRRASCATARSSR